MPIPYDKVFLVVLDGFGLSGPEKGNAIFEAGTPFIDSLVADYPSFSIAAAGLVVGLPWGQPGNSEVGHSAIGTGRIVIQDLAHINGEIRGGGFYKNEAFLQAMRHVSENRSALHLIGCTSPGGIHSHIDHLIALLDLAQRQRVKNIFVHFIADGQDMPPHDAIHVLETLKPFLAKSGARIASVQGRSYAMDRILNWKLTEKVWHAVALGDAPGIEDPAAYIDSCYKAGQTDYDIEPRTVVTGGKPVGALNDNDALIFFDFRNDRVKQLATPFVYVDSFDSFNLIRRPKNVMIATMTKYAEDFKVPTAYLPPKLSDTLGEIIAQKGWSQWRIAEKEKEAHVTNFFNGGRIQPFEGESRQIVSSRMMKGAEYIEHPEMSAGKIVAAVRERAGDRARLYVINFANPDMIGHTGNLEATKKAIQITDDCMKQLISELIKEPGSIVMLTADHGNAEELLDPLTGGTDTQHSARSVPLIFIAQDMKGQQKEYKKLSDLSLASPIGTLVDIAPSALHLLGLEKPDDMSGSSLI